MAWLGTWANRLGMTILNTNVDGDLTNFPIMIHLSADCGANSFDASIVFDELTADANRKKIAVTQSDGTTQCYVEVAFWDDANEQALLYFKAPSVTTASNIAYYLYYDSAQADNDTYVGDTTSAVSQNVWDANFTHVYHLTETSDGTAGEFKDSTSNANHGAGGSSISKGNPTKVTNELGLPCQHLDGVNDCIVIPDANGLSIPVPGSFTAEFMYSPSVLDMNWSTQNFAPMSKLEYIDEVFNKEWTFQFYDSDAFTSQARYHWCSFYVYATPPAASSPGGNYQPASLMDIDSWWHMCGTAVCTDSTHGIEYMYRNGEHNGDEDTWESYGAEYIPNASHVIVGHNEISPANLWVHARFYDVRFSNTARSQAWMKATFYTNQDNIIAFSTESTPTGTNKFAVSGGSLYGVVTPISIQTVV